MLKATTPAAPSAQTQARAPGPEARARKSAARGGPRVLAIASGGGHWVQLLRLRPAFAGCQILYATVSDGYRAQVGGAPFYVVPDCNRWGKLSVLWCACCTGLLLLRLRPDVIVTTGAAPGYVAVHLGRWLGARTVWLDSIANADELSLSGQMAGGKADLWLTQWPHLQGEKEGPRYCGNVL